jgi:hypothetical protein
MHNKHKGRHCVPEEQRVEPRQVPEAAAHGAAAVRPQLIVTAINKGYQCTGADDSTFAISCDGSNAEVGALAKI